MSGTCSSEWPDRPFPAGWSSEGPLLPPAPPDQLSATSFSSASPSRGRALDLVVITVFESGGFDSRNSQAALCSPHCSQRPRADESVLVSLSSGVGTWENE